MGVENLFLLSLNYDYKKENFERIITSTPYSSDLSMTRRSGGFNRTQEICTPSYPILYSFMRFSGKIGHTVDLRPQYPAHLRNPTFATAALHIICIYIY